MKNRILMDEDVGDGDYALSDVNGVEMEVDPGNELCPYVLALLRKFVGPQISSSTVSEFPRR